MTSMPDNILHLPEYHVLGTKVEEHDLHFQVEAPVPMACEECGVEGEFVRFGKRDVAYRDLPIHGKRVTLWGAPSLHVPGLREDVSVFALGHGG